MPFYTYKCEAGHETDSRARYGDNTPRTCPVCGRLAKRQTVYLITPFLTEEINRHITPQYLQEQRDNKGIKVSKFMEAAEELDYEHKKQEEILQKEIPTPDYFHEGYRQGKAIAAGKRPPTKEKF